MSKNHCSEAQTGLNEFWSECQKLMESEKDIEVQSDKDFLPSVQNDSEKANEFLSALGISDLCPSFPDEDLQAILTEDQVATIRKRVDTVRSKKANGRMDVRSIFVPDNDTLDNNNNKNSKEIGDCGDNDKDKHNNNNNNNDVSSSSGITLQYDEDDDDEEENDEDEVVEELEVLENVSKVNSHRKNPFSGKKDEFGLFGYLPFVSKNESLNSAHIPPTPTICPDKVDKSIAMEVTIMEDLGRKDRHTLQALAQIELMGVFDKFKVESVRHKSKKKSKSEKEGVFGVRLECLLERDNEGGGCHKTPYFFKQLLSYMEENFMKVEGILRLSGSFNRIKDIRKEIDATWYLPNLQSTKNNPSNPPTTTSHLNNPTTSHHTNSSTCNTLNDTTSGDPTTNPSTSHPSSNTTKRFSFKDLRVNDAVGLLKIFLRDLPLPLFTLQWIDSFIQIAKIPNVCMQRYCISLLMLLLPEVNRNTLKALLSFMRNITSESIHNRMTEQSVCMIMAPNLFLLPNHSLSHSNTAGGSDKVSMERDLKVATSCTTVMKLMLKHLHEMVIVPAGLINQIRRKNHESSKKKQKFWRKERRLVGRPVYKMMISVHLEPYTDEVSYTLKRHTSVADVITTIVKHSKSKVKYNSLEEILKYYSLYEIGGNIEERRLENGTLLSNIIQVNPAAKYVIRPLPPPSPFNPTFLSTTRNQL